MACCRRLMQCLECFLSIGTFGAGFWGIPRPACPPSQGAGLSTAAWPLYLLHVPWRGEEGRGFPLKKALPVHLAGHFSAADQSWVTAGRGQKP